MRMLLGVIFLVIAGGIIGIALSGDSEMGSTDLLLNLGTEIIGIVITVAIVEHFLEKRQSEASARRIAWEALHAIDHAVWVWQGGAREFDVDELMCLLSLARSDDPIPRFTQNLFLRIGGRADNTLRTRPNEMRALSSLSVGLKHLRPLSAMRDTDELLPTEVIIEILRTSTIELAKAVGTPFSNTIPEGSLTRRSTTISAQEWRHFGSTSK